MKYSYSAFPPNMQTLLKQWRTLNLSLLWDLVDSPHSRALLQLKAETSPCVNNFMFSKREGKGT